jgi:hypothetical protein
MSTELNILTIDTQIFENFTEEKNRLNVYKLQLESINKSLELKNLKGRVKDALTKSKDNLINYINDIENNISFNFYMSETAEILEKYKEILNCPMKLNFLGKSTKNNKEKDELIDKYVEIASKYVIIEVLKKQKDKIICKNCNSKEFDIIDNNIHICINCSAQQIIMKNISSYKDIDRVNISSKYIYDRRIHFRDCINQYQGKQNSTINQKVYDDLEQQFELHHLLVGDKNTPKNIRFKNILKEHINIFLKELNYSKHYENVNLIHYNITGKKPDDISHLEDRLLEDFDILTEFYDKNYKHIDRKNFINTQYVLYQLLLKHKHPCNKEDFTILKTLDRKTFHDEIMSNIFLQLGWNFVPFI